MLHPFYRASWAALLAQSVCGEWAVNTISRYNGPAGIPRELTFVLFDSYTGCVTAPEEITGWWKEIYENIDASKTIQFFSTTDCSQGASLLYGYKFTPSFSMERLPTNTRSFLVRNAGSKLEDTEGFATTAMTESLSVDMNRNITTLSGAKALVKRGGSFYDQMANGDMFLNHVLGGVLAEWRLAEVTRGNDPTVPLPTDSTRQRDWANQIERQFRAWESGPIQGEFGHTGGWYATLAPGRSINDITTATIRHSMYRAIRFGGVNSNTWIQFTITDYTATNDLATFIIWMD